LSTVLPTVGGVSQAPTTAQSRDVTRGSYNLHEAYAELSAPLLSGLPLIDTLELDAAARYSRYSTVGGKATGKLGILYRPVASTLIRGTYSQGFRAPSILELYQGQRQTNFQTVDPCNSGGAGQPGCAGVPATYNQSQFNGGLTRGITAGNTALKPESAETYSLGVAFTPPSVKGLSFTADKFLIKVKDAIASQSATQLLQSCATTGNFCDLVQRAPTGEVLQLTQAVVNLSRIEVAGIDATIRYVFPFGGGKIDSALDLAYLEKYRSYVPQPDGSVVVDDRAGKSDQPRSTFPRMKGQASLRYLAAKYSAGWKVRYIGHSADLPGNAVNGGTVPATLYHDLQLNYTLPGGKVSLSAGVDNVFNQQPPLSAANNPINFDIYTYDVRGRYLYAKVSSKF
jgi:iron complex outermembrane receptor protein